MYMTAREQKLLKHLLLQNRYITVTELAELMQVSTRTIHRELKSIKPLMETVGLTLDKQPGKGLKAVGSPRVNKSCLLIYHMNSMNTAPTNGNCSFFVRY